MLAVVFAIATESLFRYLSLLIEKLERWFDSDTVQEKMPKRKTRKNRA